MKSSKILYALATICLFGIGDALPVASAPNASAGIVEVYFLKFLTAETMYNLTLYNKDFSSHMKSELDDYMRSISEFLNGLIVVNLGKIADLIVSSGKQGKDADNCIELASDRMKMAEQSIAKNCSKSDLASINNVTSEIESIIDDGKRLFNNFDDVVADCGSSDHSQVQKCITRKLAKMRTRFETLQDNANFITQNGNKLRARSTSSFTCSEGLQNIAKRTISQAHSAGLQCVKEIPSNSSSS